MKRESEKEWYFGNADKERSGPYGFHEVRAVCKLLVTSTLLFSLWERLFQIYLVAQLIDTDGSRVALYLAGLPSYASDLADAQYLGLDTIFIYVSVSVNVCRMHAGAQGGLTRAPDAPELEGMFLWASECECWELNPLAEQVLLFPSEPSLRPQEVQRL